MGRSDLQGTPWHYEYGKGDNIYNSKNCIYNIGYCSNKASINHKKQCIGKLECEDFERSTAKSQSIDLHTKKKELPHTNLTKKELKKKRNKEKVANNIAKVMDKHKRMITVCVNDSVTVMDIESKEFIEIPISDPKNPFVGKKKNDVVSLRNVKYKIVKLSKYL